MHKILNVLFSLLIIGNLNSQDWTSDKLDIYYSYDEFSSVLSNSNDTTYLVNFWATWCGPCVKELPYFEELTKKYAKYKLKVVLVSLDFEKQIESRLIPFLNKNKIKSEVMVLLDKKESRWIEKVDSEWSGAIPITIVYNSSKRNFYERSFRSTNELEQILKEYINH